MSWLEKCHGIVALAVVGCSEPPAKVVSSVPAEPTPVALATCGIGTRIAEGGAECVPVGPTDVPEGFESAKDDWGFRAINPWGLCPERFLSTIGDATCVGIDVPCPADFPQGATVVHDQAELVAALASSAPGATLALDDGTYDPIVIDRDVNLVGRCPERVVLRGTGVDAEGHGITVAGPHAVSLRSLTIRDATYAVWASDGAKISVERTRFTSNGAAAWIVQGARIDMWHVLVEGGDSPMADGILVGRGGHAEVEETELRDMHIALQAFGTGSTVKGRTLVVTDRSPEPMSALLVASHGGKVDVKRSLVFAQRTFIGGAIARDPREAGSAPAAMRIESSEVLRILPTDAGGFDVSGGSSLELVNDTFETRARVAISAEDGAKVSLERTVIRPLLPTDASNRGVGAGIVLDDGARVVLDRSAILGVAQSAVLASRKCHVKAVGSLVADVWEFARKDFGKRMDSGQAISLSGDAALELVDSTLADNAGASIWTDGGNEASVKLERVIVASTRERDRSSAVVGLLALSGTVDVRDSLVHGMESALAFGDVTGAVFGTTISKNDVAYRFFGQSRGVAADGVDQPPAEGELLTHDNVIVETPTLTTEEPVPLGDCGCEEKAR